MAGAKFIKVKISPELLQNLKRAEDAVLPAMAPLAEAAAGAALERSKALVPVETGELVASAYTKAVAVDPGDHLVSAEAGYSADHAAYAHEMGGANKPAPKFLSKAARKGRARFKKAVVTKLNDVLAKLFPPPK